MKKSAGGGSRILTVGFFADLLDETQAQYADTSQIELQLDTFGKSLAQVEREIENMLELAATFGAHSAGPKIVKLEADQARLRSEIKQLEARRAAAQIEISSEALALALNIWCNQITKAQDTHELKNLFLRFVSKIELGYNMARIWYEYPLDTLERNAPPWGHITIKCQEPVSVEWS